MKFGAVLLIAALATGWWWVAILGATVMLAGLLFSYRTPQEDPVWRKLRTDNVIDEDGE